MECKVSAIALFINLSKIMQECIKQSFLKKNRVCNAKKKKKTDFLGLIIDREIIKQFIVVKLQCENCKYKMCFNLLHVRRAKFRIMVKEERGGGGGGEELKFDNQCRNPQKN